MFKRVSVTLVCALLAASSLGAQGEATTHGDFLLGPGDVLNIVVWKNPDLTMTVPVRPDGWISLPLINDIKVTGRTPMELQKALTDEFVEYISKPVVSVIVAEVKSFQVSVLGKVASPGRYALDGPTTVLDALAMAGGWVEYADLNDMFLLRPRAETYQRIRVNYSHAIKPSGKAVNINLQPGDIIMVP